MARSDVHFDELYEEPCVFEGDQKDWDARAQTGLALALRLCRHHELEGHIESSRAQKWRLEQLHS